MHVRRMVQIGAAGGVSDWESNPNCCVSDLYTRCKRDATLRVAAGGTVHSCVLQVSPLRAQAGRFDVGMRSF